MSVYRCQYPEAFETASDKLNWIIGGINTVVLLVSSLFMVLAVHYAKLGPAQALLLVFLALTALLGVVLSGASKGCEYYIDYRDNLIPGWRFDDAEWIAKDGLTAGAGAARQAVPAVLLDHDRPARPARDHRHHRGAGDARPGAARPFLAGVLLAGGRDGALLALCGYWCGFFCCRCFTCSARIRCRMQFEEASCRNP